MTDTPDLLLITAPRRWPRLPPLGEACIKAYLDRNGVRTDVFDMNNFCYCSVSNELRRLWELPVYPALSDNLWNHLWLRYPQVIADALAAVIEHPAQTIGISVWHSSINFSQMIAQYVRSNAPGKRIIAGGPDVTLSVLENISSAREKYFWADHLIAGEGEQSLLDYFTNHQSNIVNIICFNESPADSLPAPDFTQIMPRPYRYPGTLPVWMSRGCIRRCGFCVEHTLSKSFRIKPADRMAGELRHLYETSGVRHVIFYDSLINGNVRVLEQFLDIMIDTALPVKWEAQLLIRPDMPDQIYEKMKRAGCYNLFIGMENGCDRILSLMNKRFTTADAVRALAICRDIELHCEISLIIGYPGETADDFAQTCAFIEQNAHVIPKIAQINPFIPLPGSPVMQSAGGVPCPSGDVVQQRIDTLTDLCRGHGIAITPAYINNLTALKAGFDVQSGNMIV